MKKVRAGGEDGLAVEFIQAMTPEQIRALLQLVPGHRGGPQAHSARMENCTCCANFKGGDGMQTRRLQTYHGPPRGPEDHNEGLAACGFRVLNAPSTALARVPHILPAGRGAPHPAHPGAETLRMGGIL